LKEGGEFFPRPNTGGGGGGETRCRAQRGGPAGEKKAGAQIF